MAMIIADHPRHKPWPEGFTHNQKLEHVSTGKVTVGRFGRIRSNDFVHFFLPRIRGMNFVLNSRKYRHPGYQTADQAYSAGHVLKGRFQADAQAGPEVE